MDSSANFDRLREIILQQPALVEKLVACQSDAELFALVIAAARDRGFSFDEAQLSNIANLNRRRWLERWTLQ